jgi:hypothetical protein
MGTDENQAMKKLSQIKTVKSLPQDQFDKSPVVLILYTILEQKQTKR